MMKTLMTAVFGTRFDRERKRIQPIVDQIHRHRLKVTEVPVVIRYSDYSMRKGQSSLAAFRIAVDYLMKRLFR